MNGADDDEERTRQRTNYVVLAVAAVIVAAGLLLLHFMNGYLAQERCREEGRRDCDPIALPVPS